MLINNKNSKHKSNRTKDRFFNNSKNNNDNNNNKRTGKIMEKRQVSRQ